MTYAERIREGNIDGEIQKWLKEIRNRDNEKNSDKDILTALHETILWMQRDHLWMEEYAVKTFPLSSELIAPNDTQLFNADGGRRISLMIPRIPGTPANERCDQQVTALDKLVNYWSSQNLVEGLDPNDRFFLRQLQVRSAPENDTSSEAELIERLLADADQAQAMMRINCFFAKIAWVLTAYERISDDLNATLQALHRAQDQIRKENVNLATLQLDSKALDSLASSLVALRKFRQVQGSNLYSFMWAANQLRPSLIYTGKIFSIYEEPSRIRFISPPAHEAKQSGLLRHSN